MTRELRRDIFEGIGLVALVTSLIFLAWETQQNTIAVKSEAAQGLQNQIHDAYALFLEDSVTDIVIQGMADASSLSQRDAAVFEAFWSTILNAYQNIYYQVQTGTFDESLAEGWWQELRINLESPGLKQFWNTRSFILSQEFREFVEAEVMTRQISPNYAPHFGLQEPD